MTTIKILVYSQDAPLRESVKLILGKQYDLILTDSRQQCQECLKNTAIDVVMADLSNIKSEDNWLEPLKSLPNTPYILALIPRRHAEAPQIKSLVKTADQCIAIKPIKEEELLKALKALNCSSNSTLSI